MWEGVGGGWVVAKQNTGKHQGDVSCIILGSLMEGKGGGWFKDELRSLIINLIYLNYEYKDKPMLFHLIDYCPNILESDITFFCYFNLTLL